MENQNPPNQPNPAGVPLPGPQNVSFANMQPQQAPQQAPQIPEQPQNPLAKHFRQPKIHLALPSKGQYWKPNALELPATGEVPIFAMTAKDEVALRTPDGLMNGQSMVSVIESCCPSVRDAWGMPSIDTDALLIAIRIASFGEDMDVNSTCPKCEHENTYSLPLGQRLAGITMPDYNTPVQIDDLGFKLKPQYYDAITRLSQLRFQEERINNVVVDMDMPEEEKSKQLTDGFSRIMDMGFDNITASTEAIVMPDGTQVTDGNFIKEFFQNADAGVMRELQDKLVEIQKTSSGADLKLKCTNCNHEWEAPLEFDYSSFFAEASSN